MTVTYSLQSITLAQILQMANHFADYPGTCLLYSGGERDSAQRSYLGLFPFETLTLYEKQAAHVKEGEVQSWLTGNPWDALNAFFLQLAPEEYAFGFIGYGMGSFVNPAYSLPYYSSDIPDAYWQRCAFTLCFDHQAQSATVWLNTKTVSVLNENEKRWIEKFATAETFQDWLCSLPFPFLSKPCSMTSINNNDSCRRSSYLSKIEKVKEFIREGQVYQINLSQQFLFRGHKRPFDAFYQLAHLNPAPFSAYLNLFDYTLVSTSPERFLHKNEDRLETRPIKGTIRRGSTSEEDQRLKEQLLNSPKERAELLMITDLMRNDLGKISQTGSVKTIALWHCEAYTNVFHLLSIIQSKPLTHLSSCDLIKHCFPGGSITGCPKYRAMELIAELEQTSRGVYTGSIGYIQGNGNFDLNVAIRTLVFKQGEVDLRLGGGIVIDSQAENEYEETLIKGQTIFNVLER